MYSMLLFLCLLYSAACFLGKAPDSQDFFMENIFQLLPSYPRVAEGFCGTEVRKDECSCESAPLQVSELRFPSESQEP